MRSKEISSYSNPKYLRLPFINNDDKTDNGNGNGLGLEGPRYRSEC